MGLNKSEKVFVYVLSNKMLSKSSLMLALPIHIKRDNQSTYNNGKKKSLTLHPVQPVESGTLMLYVRYRSKVKPIKNKINFNLIRDIFIIFQQINSL